MPRSLGDEAFFTSVLSFFFPISYCSFLIFSICQSMGASPFFSRNSLVWLKCLHPKNPLDADSGLGCAAVSTSCFGLFSIAFFIWAGLPQRRYTIGRSCSFKVWITASVNCSQPIPLWENAWWARTVSTVFRRNTPCFAHFSRQPLFRNIAAQVTVELFINVYQRRRNVYIFSYREAKTVGLSIVVVGITDPE